MSLVSVYFQRLLRAVLLPLRIKILVEEIQLDINVVIVQIY